MTAIVTRCAWVFSTATRKVFSQMISELGKRLRKKYTFGATVFELLQRYSQKA